MKKELMDKNPLLKLTFQFSLHIIAFTETLEASRKFNLANQLFRSGTSIGANAMEAQNAESKADFVHKLKIAAKEAEETQYWLMLCNESKSYPETKKLQDKLEEIQKVLGSIISASKKRQKV